MGQNSDRLLAVLNKLDTDLDTQWGRVGQIQRCLDKHAARLDSLASRIDSNLARIDALLAKRLAPR